jgi:hypothetical protein
MRPLPQTLVLSALFAVGMLSCKNSPLEAPSHGPPASGDGSASQGISLGEAGLACGAAPFYPADFDQACQGALDLACCDEQKACAALPDCVGFLRCVNACPPPRRSECVNACGEDAAASQGWIAMGALADCTKGPTLPVRCNWPAAGCGELVFYPAGYPAACQTALDAECCTWEGACALHAACRDLVACINSCPAPRQGACVDACRSGDAGAAADLNAILACASASALPENCTWPK